MQRLIILFSAGLFLSFNTTAQKKEFTLSDAVIGGYSKFRPETTSQLRWLPNENSVSWINLDTSNVRLVKRNVDSKEEITLITLNELKNYEELKELSRFPRITWVTNFQFKFQLKEKQFLFDIKKKELDNIGTLPIEAANIDISSKNSMIAYTYENSLIVDEIQIGVPKNNDIVFGQSVHRFEFGISKGTFWSNSGNLLAYYKKDESMVTNYPLANYTTKPAESKIIKYPMSGMPSHQVTVGIWNSDTKKSIWVKTTGPKDQYLTNIAWSPDDKAIYIAILNRDQNEMKLNQYDPLTGEFVRTLFTEKHDKYVQPLNPMEFIGSNGENFIWQSERDGFNNLYLYTNKGKMIKQLTAHKAPITSVVQVQGDNSITYVVADNNGLDRIGYQLNLATGKTEIITPESGMHSIRMSVDGNYYIDTYSSISVRRNTNVHNLKGKKVMSFIENKNPYEDYNVRLPELSTIKTTEGTILNTRMFKPVDFDPSKKYKALLYVYNGPGVQLITNSWMAGGSPWMAYQANKGYVVYTVDGRGSENRGRDFEQKIFRNLGEFEVVDQLSAAEYLINLDYVDRNKMAVHGWSYGGFMTTSLMLKAPGIFQVGVAGGPVIDWKYYEIMYTERYMDTPEQNPTGYAKASLLDKVQNLKGDLLLIHGANDDVVVPQNSIDLLKQSVDKGVQIDFFLYPGHKHNVRGKDRIHLMEKVLSYIDEKLE
jgi:dipeptidyl-peptidase-4